MFVNTVFKPLAVAVSGDIVAVPVVAYHTVAHAHFLAADAMKALGTRGFAIGADEARSAHAGASLWVALAFVSARVWASLAAVGTELAWLAWPIATQTFPP